MLVWWDGGYDKVSIFVVGMKPQSVIGLKRSRLLQTLVSQALDHLFSKNFIMVKLLMLAVYKHNGNEPPLKLAEVSDLSSFR